MSRRGQLFVVSGVSCLMLLAGCGNTSSPVKTAGTVQLSSISPAQAAQGAGDLFLRGYGTGFTAQSTLRWAGSSLTTQFVSSGEIDATIPAADLVSAGTFQVSVADPNFTTTGSTQAFVVTVAMGSGNILSLVSIAHDGTQGNGNGGMLGVSSDGRFIAFASYATNLVSGTNSFANVYLRDTCLHAQGACTPATILVSSGVAGSLANGDSGMSVFQFPTLGVSSSGRYVAFEADASNLVANDTNGVGDIFVRDTCTGATGCTSSTALISVSSANVQANAASTNPAITPDGRFIVFESAATNLVPGVATGYQNIYERDTCIGAPAGCQPSTVLISTPDPAGSVSVNGLATGATVSQDGRFVAFNARATNLAAGSNSLLQVYLRDTCIGATGCNISTSLVSVSSAGTVGSGPTGESMISSSGRFIVFESSAPNLVSAAANDASDIFVRDTCLGVSGCSPTTVRLTSGSGNANSLPTISADGTVAAYVSAPNSGTGVAQVYAVAVCATGPVCTNAPMEISVGANGAANFNSGSAVLSPDGHTVGFGSGASNLLPAVTNGKLQLYQANSTF